MRMAAYERTVATMAYIVINPNACRLTTVLFNRSRRISKSRFVESAPTGKRQVECQWYIFLNNGKINESILTSQYNGPLTHGSKLEICVLLYIYYLISFRLRKNQIIFSFDFRPQTFVHTITNSSKPLNIVKIVL